METKNFDEYLEKWYKEKQIRYIAKKLKGGYGIFDSISFTFLESSNGSIVKYRSNDEEIYMTGKDTAEQRAIEYVNARNAKWKIELQKLYENRKKNPNIWDPMFDEFSTGRKTLCKEQNENPKSEEKLEDSSSIQDKELTKVRI